MEYSGALNILKPPGMTSFNVVQFIRKNLDMKKVGHAGTLDPMAAGVLPVFIGKATKSIDDFINKNKRYIAEIEFGIETSTYDTEGEIVNRFEGEISLENIDDIIHGFKGQIKQRPPMYSAIKIDGKKLYKLARKGIEVERPERDINIYDIEILKKSERRVLVDVSCSKGTYIRSLCHDIGRESGYYAVMNFLLRVQAGDFKLENSYTLEETADIAARNEIEKILITPEKLYHDIDRLVMDDKDIIKIMNGMTVVLDDCSKTGRVGIFSKDNKLFAICMILYIKNKYYIKKIRGFA